jgi:hypothetical protein
MDKIGWQPPHTIDEKGYRFLESLSQKERELHTMASKMLGSSYFVEKTHAFKKWEATQATQAANPNTSPPKAK